MSRIQSMFKKAVSTMLFMCMIHCGTQVHAQVPGDEIKSFLLKVESAYKSSSYLGFRVKYAYANTGGTGDGADSLSGIMQMDKGRCRMVLAGMETVTTGRYVIQIMPDDKAIYLSSAKASSSINPVQLLDSMLLKTKDIHGSVSSIGGMDVLTLQFPPGNLYSRIRMEADAQTGYFQRIVYQVRTEGLVGRDLVESPGHPAPYKPEGEVTMLFSGYEKGRFGDSLFDETNFFIRTGGKFEPAARYSDYHIFLASSNL